MTNRTADKHSDLKELLVRSVCVFFGIVVMTLLGAVSCSGDNPGLDGYAVHQVQQVSQQTATPGH